MLNWEGNIIDKKYIHHFLLSAIEEDATISITSKFCSMEMQAVKTLVDAAHQDDGRPGPVFTPSPRKVDRVSTVLASISPTLEDALLYDSLKYRSEMGKFKFSIGSTNYTHNQLVIGRR